MVSVGLGDRPVVQIHGLCDVIFKACDFRRNQKLHVRIGSRGGAGPLFKAGKALTDLLQMALAGRKIGVSGGRGVGNGGVKMKSHFEQHTRPGQCVGFGLGCFGGGRGGVPKPVSQ